MKKITLFIALLMIGFFACDNNTDTPTDGSTGKIVTEEWIKNLDTPWQITFAPDGKIFFTERPGRVRVVKDGVMSTWLDLTGIVESGESGLLGIAIDPNYISNGYVYIAYTYSTPQEKFNNRIVRCKEDKATGKGVEDKIYIDGIKGFSAHHGGPIKIGPDKKLYWTVGDRFDESTPQDLTSLNGKILRLNLDGTVPSDNPFPNSYVWSYGHRNSQGLAWQEGTNNLFSTEHGPSNPNIDCCKDELNIIEKGKNYGWPDIRGTETKAGMESPIWVSGSDKTWAPAGATFIKNGKWKGSLLFVGLRAETLYRAVIDPNNPRKILRIEEYMKHTYGRLRDVAEAPDGTIYICVSNKDGRGKPRAEDDRIIKLSIQ